MTDPITYAVVDGPPLNWRNLIIKDTHGRVVRDVIEVNTVEGWCRVYARDLDGVLIIDNDSLVIKKIEGTFTIEVKSDA